MRSYAEIYILVCDITRKSAEEKLKRSLKTQEVAHIYNAGSMMILESIGNAIELGSAKDLSDCLQSTAHLDHVNEIRNQLPITLEENLLHESLSPSIIEKLNQLPYVYTAHQIILAMEQTPQKDRYKVLIHTVDELI